MAEYHPECWETFLRGLKSLTPAPIPIAAPVAGFPWWLVILLGFILFYKGEK